MKALLCSLIAIALAPASVNACIGETLDQLMHRFGPDRTERYPGQSEYSFQFKDWWISVQLLNGRSAHERYAIVLGPDLKPGGKRPLSQEDIDSILQINGGGKKWNKLSETDAAREAESQAISVPSIPRRLENAWMLEDHSLICIQVNEAPIGSSITVMSKEVHDRVTAQVREARAKTTPTSGGPPDTARIRELESELARLKPKSSDVRPSEADMLAVGKQLCDNTVLMARSPDGREGDAVGLEVNKVTILDTSMEGSTCVVVFDLQVNFLPAFKNSRGVSWTIFAHEPFKPQLAKWLKTDNFISGDPSAFSWDHQWYASQQGFRGLNFQKIKVRMKKWDSGWKLDEGYPTE
jgi:hypothetical protein